MSYSDVWKAYKINAATEFRDSLLAHARICCTFSTLLVSLRFEDT